jgi:hypothetical protein
MPVEKYRSIDDMPGETWHAPGEPELYRALTSLWTASRRLRPRRFPRGVFRHRSIDDMNHQREQWDRDDAALR